MKKKKRAKVSLTLLKRLRARAVFLRDHHRCVRCGRTEALAPSHIYPAGRYPRMAWEIDNIKALCYGCHIMWWHKHPLEAAEWLQTAIPKERLDRLKLMSQQHLPPIDRVKIKAYYEQLIAKYEQEEREQFNRLG